MPAPEIRDWVLENWPTGLAREQPSRAEDITWTRIGEDRGFTGAIHRATGPRASVIVKIPDTEENFERCAREANFLRDFGPRCGVTTPQMFASHADPSNGAVWLILEDLIGREGDAADGCDANVAADVLHSLASMHAAWADDATLSTIEWLPLWGTGQVDAPRPHRRRAERLRTRAPMARTRIGSRLSPALDRVITRLEDEFETMLEAVAAWPRTLIHADLHLDNLIWCPAPTGEQLVVLDWQSVSHGPALYDVARFLVESLHSSTAHEQIFDLLDGYLARRNELSGREDTIDRRDFNTMILVVIAGFISAYGNERLASLPPRLQSLFELSFSEDRLAGLVELLDPA